MFNLTSRIVAGLVSLGCALGVTSAPTQANVSVVPRQVQSQTAPTANQQTLGQTRSNLFWRYVDGAPWVQQALCRLKQPTGSARRLVVPVKPKEIVTVPVVRPQPAPDPVPDTPVADTPATPGADPASPPATPIPVPVVPAPEPDPAPDETTAPDTPATPAPEPAPAPTPAPEPAPAPVPAPAPQPVADGLTAEERLMVQLVNSERASAGLSPVEVDLRLVQTARTKSQDLITYNYFSHNSPRLGSPFDQMKAAGIRYMTAGENLAGNQTVEAAHRALMNSPGHRANILNRNFNRIGIGIIRGGQYGIMVTQQFIGV